MPGQPVSDLRAMLAGMAPVLDESPFRFDANECGDDFNEHAGKVFALVREAEGITRIIRADEDNPGPLFGCVTLQVHSDLEGVGLTAAVSTALAEAGIACNVIAGFHHDHLFVPWPSRHDAMTILQSLSQDARR